MSQTTSTVSAHRLTTLRHGMGWSIADLAFLIDLSPSTIWNAENPRNGSQLHYSSAEVIARAFGVEVSELFDDVELTDHGRPAQISQPDHGRRRVTELRFCPKCNVSLPGSVLECVSDGPIVELELEDGSLILALAS